jgi:hypothetical protein
MCCGGYAYSPNLAAMKRRVLCLIASALLFSPLARSQDPDPEKQSEEQQMKQADEAARGMGLNMPDMQKLLDENEKEEKAEAAETKKKEAAKPAGPIALPDWTPQVPQFKADGPPARKMIEGKEMIVVTGTSPAPPDALVAEWEKFKNPKFSHESGGSSINGSADLYVSYSRAEDFMDAVKMEAERKAGAKITRVTMTSPVR